jgi:hypothetical protein
MQMWQIILFTEYLCIMGLARSWRPRYDYLYLFIILSILKLLTKFLDVLLKALLALPFKLKLFHF